MRRTKYELRQRRGARATSSRACSIALDNIDEVIELIRALARPRRRARRA